MLVALSAIAAQQSSPTEETMQKTLKILDYVATHPDAILTYEKSDMVLNVHSDASYLIKSKARSRAGGHFSCHRMSSMQKITEKSSILQK